MIDAPRMLVQLTEEELQARLAEAVELAVARVIGPAIERAIAGALKAQRTELAPEHDQLTVREAAHRLRCCERQVRRMVALRRLPSVKLGQGGSARLFIPRRAVEALLKQSTH